MAVPALALAPMSDSKVGDTLSLTGTNTGEKLDVTVVKVVDPAGAGPYDHPSSGKRFVSVQFRLKNTGTAVYKDSPSNGTTVIDKDGQRFSASLNNSTAGPPFPGSVTVGTGKTALGFITFEVPTASRIVSVQFAMNSGFSDDVGEWQLPSASSGR
ncbi:DUF4352 domain-containing protein [Streptomyces sp. NPDC091280]|uniref:DUF4352 domain-containing protein n=1 Tax=Streptomyces sp. NPDC091280 TaxID=3365984 RepID=UPI00380FEDD5